MPYESFRIRLRKEILQSMVNHVVASTPLNDVRDGSVLMQILGAAAMSDEQIYLQLSELLTTYSLRNAQGDDLDERAKDFDETRNGESSAVGYVVFGRVGTSGTITIPAGSRVGQSGNSLVYRTTAAGEISNGDSTSDPVPILAEQAGEESNAGPGVVTKIVSRTPGAQTVTNPATISGGAAKEGDEAFRRRLEEKFRTLPLCTPKAITGLVRGVTAPNGKTVRSLLVVEREDQPGRFTLYIDDGLGTAESTTTTGEDIVLTPGAGASGGERRFQLPQFPVKRGTTFTLVLNKGLGGEETLVSYTDNIDPDVYQYALQHGTGNIYLNEVTFPTGLTAADTLTVESYTYYTELIAEVQWKVDGRGDNPTDYPGWGAAGSLCTVCAPTTIARDIELAIVVSNDFSREVVKPLVQTALINYINTLDIGEDAILGEMIRKAMEIDGVVDVNFTSPTENIPIADDQVMRVASSNVTVL